LYDDTFLKLRTSLTCRPRCGKTACLGRDVSRPYCSVWGEAMTITRDVVSNQLLAYLNGQLSLAALVNWAENTFIDDVLAPESDVDMLNDVLSYLATADTAQFPLTWAICAEFLQKLGVQVQVVRVQESA